MKVKRDPADDWFSKYIRLRDSQCVRCGSEVRFNDNGDPISHHASHFYGRGNESVRFDPLNVDTHCHGCHRYFTANPATFRDWKLEQLGQEEFDKLTLRSNTPQKKDREIQKLIWRQEYKKLKGLT